MTKVQTSADIFHPELPLDHIRPSPTNPRKHLTQESIDEMAASIREHGVAQPILVRPQPHQTEGWFEVVFGERRFRGSLKAGRSTIPAIERDLDDKTVRELQLVENLQRENVHEIDEANGYRELMEKHGHTALEIAQRVSKSEKYVYDRLKLLRLIQPLQEIFLAGKITAGHAILLARLSELRQIEAMDQALHNLSVRALAKKVQEPSRAPGDPQASTMDRGKPESPSTKMHSENAEVLQVGDPRHPGFTYQLAAQEILRSAANGIPAARAALASIMSEMGRIGGRKLAAMMTKKERHEAAKRAGIASGKARVQTSALTKKRSKG